MLAREAELKTLRAQIDPHFLFNSLHSINGLIGADPAAARRMTVLLGDFLRTSVAVGQRPSSPLGEELQLVDRYLAIEQIRFGKRLTVATEIDPALRDCLVPPLLLHPLVENAITHGIAHVLDGGSIRVEATRNGSLAYVTVTNTCDPDRQGAAAPVWGSQTSAAAGNPVSGRERPRVRELADEHRVELRFPIRTADLQQGDWRRGHHEQVTRRDRGR